MKTIDKALQVVRDNIKDQDAEKLKHTSQVNRYNELIQEEVFNNNQLQHDINRTLIKQKSG